MLKALFILLAMSISIASLVWFVFYGGSLWWLVAADLLLLATCREALTALLETWVPIIAATDVFGIVLLAVLILLAPFFAPVALYWTLRRAFR